MNLASFFESAVSKENAGRTVDILKSRISRITGQEIYATKVMDITIGSEGKSYGIFMMFSDGHHAIRLRWKSSDTSASIIGIDFWISVAQNPQFSANTEGMNINQIVSLIDDVLKGIPVGQKELVESYIVEAAGHNMKDVKVLLDKAGYSIESDPAFTVRRFLITNKKSGVVTPIRYTPKVGEMYDELKSLGVEGFIDAHNAGGSIAQSGRVITAAKQAPAPMPSSPFDSLFEDPLSEAELFGLLEKGINDVKSGKSKTLIICGDPGIGKCVHYTLDLPVQFL